MDIELIIFFLLLITHLVILKKLQKEIKTLRRWKKEACIVFNDWDKAWEAAGKPGQLGSSKAKSTYEYILTQKHS